MAGGTKYVQEGIVFKVALDTHGLYGGSSNSGKSAAHELKGINTLINLEIPNLCFPLFVVLDYRGFRVSAMSLLPIDKSSIIYGSPDGGLTYYYKNELLANKMETIGQLLNLKKHFAMDHHVRMPIDLEAHLGKDGYFYIIDTARIMPPEPPSGRGTYLWRLLRPEFVTKYSSPLCSDAFTRFIDADKEKDQHNQEIEEASQFLVEELVPRFAKHLETRHHMQDNASNVENLTSSEELPLNHELHKFGLNVRMIGLVYLRLKQAYWKRRVLTEMVTRVAKATLRALIRHAMERIKLPSDEPYFSVVVQYLNLLLGSSIDSKHYWKDELKLSIKASFFYRQQEKFPEEEIQVRHVDKIRLIKQLVGKMGVTLKESSLKKLLNETFLSQEQPFSEDDVLTMEPTTKQIDLLEISNAFKQLQRTYGRTPKDLQESVISLDKFSSMDNTSYMMGYYCALASFQYCIIILTSPEYSFTDTSAIQYLKIPPKKITDILRDPRKFESAQAAHPYFFERLLVMARDVFKLTENTNRDWKMKALLIFIKDCAIVLKVAYQKLQDKERAQQLDQEVEQWIKKIGPKWANIFDDFNSPSTSRARAGTSTSLK
eukprot:TRINITY_DN5214_c0_g1_i1.p1 TRINITY_DN5214_c0_g1~~TRINITY_DN5214_c0_g1_i1.p1  ORF type:complete len:601 (+),score=151.75 TRINITY_DN5214_c0_g1_i1:486-2288(+)